jgi:hypothetical protein
VKLFIAKSHRARGSAVITLTCAPELAATARRTLRAAPRGNRTGQDRPCGAIQGEGRRLRVDITEALQVRTRAGGPLRSANGVALLAALVIAILASCPAAAISATPNCNASVYVIGARGSGEAPDARGGRTVGDFIDRLRAQGNGGSIGAAGLDYPAAGILDWRLLAFGAVAKRLQYDDSVKAGVTNLVKDVTDRAHACRSQTIVLSGYSQGAEVVRLALNSLKKVSSHIGGVVLFGDPKFDPHSRAAQGSFSKRRHGVLGLPGGDFPSEFPHVVSYCRDGDLVCQGFPNTTEAHKHYPPENTEQAAEKVADWLGLRRTRTCAAATNIAAILDDSGSMEANDPLNIRAAAMQLLISEPGGGGRTLGAIEFGDEAGPLFEPQPIAQGEAQMVASLASLADDGFAGTGANTNYNAAFAETKLTQPSADARIFLTDGENTEDPYNNGHQGGPRTFVIGLNMGPSGEGSEPADLLGRIAAETGGVYYPLKRPGFEDPESQIRELQPVFNSIDAELECQIAPKQAVRTLTAVGAAAKPVSSKFLGNPGVQAVITWTTPGAAVDITGASVRNPNGGLVANLTGKAPSGHGRRHRIGTLQPSIVSGATFRTVTIPRPKHGSTISIRVAASQLAEPTIVTVQLSPIETLPQGSVAGMPASTTVVPPAPAPAPAPPGPPAPVNHVEQETPNHPVNTFTNYHNASGMGPAISAGAYVEVSCRVYDPTIASVNPDGYWYRIASSPWNNAYYAPANTFMNGDPYGGPYTHNTDFSVPVC